ncbi:MAG: hypothetical protein AAGH15_03960 [Myxococcota bacterium]
MTWYADLSPLDYFMPEPGKLRAVGWLDDVHPYAKGPVASDDFERLYELLVDPWQPFIAFGRHECELCRFTSGPAGVSFRSRQVQVGVSNLFLPAGELLFVAPSTIVHYIDAHEYRPPDVFWEAVRACPPMRSMAYKRALLAAGGKALLHPGPRAAPPPGQWAARPKNTRRAPGVSEAPQPAAWCVLRMDDNGNRFEVARYATEREADDAAQRFEARGHRQTYWVEPDEPA